MLPFIQRGDETAFMIDELTACIEARHGDVTVYT